MRPYLSLIIPHYNSPKALARLLATIRTSKNAPSFEVIVVDDGSRAALRAVDPGRPGIRVIWLKKNRGPAVARNRGAARAKGKFLVFLDCDVELFTDTLAQIAETYRDDPDIVALTGIWTKEQRSHAFFPNFKALRDWSYWIHERDASGYYFLFSTRIASIKRAVFVRLGGFDESYAGPLIEDIEFTYRIARRYAIIFAPHVRVRHEFEGFWPIAKKYFWRTYYWIRLYSSRKKFDPVATTIWETAAAASGAGALALLVPISLSYLIRFGPVGYIWALWGLLMLVHLSLVRRFLWFVFREKGVVFALQSLGVGMVLYTIILCGGLYSRISMLLDEQKP